MSVFMPVPYFLDYCSFIICFEIRMCDVSSFVLSQDCLGYLGSFEVPYECKDCFVLFCFFYFCTKMPLSF